MATGTATKVATFNVHEAKTQFSRLLAQVKVGGEVIIAWGGTPIARRAAGGGAEAEAAAGDAEGQDRVGRRVLRPAPGGGVAAVGRARGRGLRWRSSSTPMR